MEVTMSNACGRCGKTEPRPVQIEEVIEARQHQQRQELALDTLEDYFNKEDAISDLADFPSLMILVKTDKGMKVRHLDNLCMGGNGKKRGCETRVATLLGEIFMDNKLTKKKKKKKAPPKEKAEEPKE